MDIHVGLLGLPVSRRLTDHCRQKVEEALERFADRVQSVQVIVEDVNGPRGGADKHCRCMVKVPHLPLIVIRDQDRDVKAVLYRVSQRLAFTLSQKLDKRFKRGRRLAHVEE